MFDVQHRPAVEITKAVPGPPQRSYGTGVKLVRFSIFSKEIPPGEIEVRPQMSYPPVRISPMNIDLALQREELEGCLHRGVERESVRLAAKILPRRRAMSDREVRSFSHNTKIGANCNGHPLSSKIVLHLKLASCSLRRDDPGSP